MGWFIGKGVQYTLRACGVNKHVAAGVGIVICGAASIATMDPTGAAILIDLLST